MVGSAAPVMMRAAELHQLDLLKEEEQHSGVFGSQTSKQGSVID